MLQKEIKLNNNFMKQQTIFLTFFQNRWHTLKKTLTSMSFVTFHWLPYLILPW